MSNFLFFFLAFPAFLIYQSACLAIWLNHSLCMGKIIKCLLLSADAADLGRYLCLLLLCPFPTAFLEIPYRLDIFGTWMLKLSMQIVNAIAAESICCLHPHQSHLSASWKQVCQDSSVPHHQVSIP